MLLGFILYFALGKQGALEGTECACVCWGWKSEHATVSGGWTWHWCACTTTRAACSLVIRRRCRWPDAGIPDVVFPGKLPEGTDRPTHGHQCGTNGVCTSLCLMQVVCHCMRTPSLSTPAAEQVFSEMRERTYERFRTVALMNYGAAFVLLSVVG
jgi:hypothetical protein